MVKIASAGTSATWGSEEQTAAVAGATALAETQAAEPGIASSSGRLAENSQTSDRARGTSNGKRSRIYCPMVYNTLSVFQHALNASICCYMQAPPGHKLVSVKDRPLSEVVNAPAFQMVRESLMSREHIPVCDTCPYGDYRA
jgi:hypothetical protein